MEDEEACFNAHPIHEACSRNGVIHMVYADIDGLVDLILGEVWPTATETEQYPVEGER